MDLSQVWITLTSVVVAFSFIFREAASNLYQSVIFLFVVHPLDVGDALLIENVYYKVLSETSDMSFNCLVDHAAEAVKRQPAGSDQSSSVSC